MRRIIQLLVLPVALISASLVLAPRAHAVVRPVVVSKSMKNSSLAAAHGNNRVGTVTAVGDAIQVNLVITNPEDQINQITIHDSLGENNRLLAYTVGSLQFKKGSLSASGDCSNGPNAGPPTNLSVTATSIQFDLSNLSKTTQYCVQYTATVSAPLLPTYRSRLVGFPVYVTDQGSATSTLYDVGYLYINPPLVQGAAGSVASSLFSSSGTNFDLGVIIPGVSVSVTGAGSSNKTITTPASFVVQPNVSQLGTVASPTKQCGVNYSANSQIGRGACMLSTTATVSDAGGSQLASSSAYLMELPSSTIVGNIFTGGVALNSNNLLLPGQHIAASGTGTGTSSAKENINYSIDKNSVSGWDPLNTNTTQIYRNVYQNANVARLLRSPDKVIDSTNCANGTYTFITCTSNDPSNGLPNIHYSATAGHHLNLSDSHLDGVVVTPRKDGYVVDVKGNLIIDNCSPLNACSIAFTNIANEVGGSIIVRGRLTIKHVSIIPSATSAPLGFIVLDKDVPAGSKAAEWNSIGGCYDSTLRSVGLFVPNGTFKATKTGSGILTMIGTIVAQDVDFSQVSLATTVNPGNVNCPLIPANQKDQTDLSGVSVQYDQALAQTPPPGFNLFSATPILKDTAP